MSALEAIFVINMPRFMGAAIYCSLVLFYVAQNRNHWNHNAHLIETCCYFTSLATVWAYASMVET